MAEHSNKAANTTQALKKWQTKIFWSVWITYASFYLCRVNMSVAMPGIMAEYNISKTVMGGVLSALFAAYAIGQFLNGQLADRFGARKLISFGLLVSAIMNAIFGFTNGVLSGMILVWAVNGYFQSMGWSPSVKTIANWFPLSKRTKYSGLLGTSYQIGNAASWALSGFIVGMFGWRWAFWLPAIICAVIAIHWLIRGRNAPEEVGLPSVEEQENGIITTKNAEKDHHLGFKYTLKTVLTKKRIWAAALSLFFLNIVRYGFMDWAPTYLFEVQKAAISTAAYKAMVIPIAGSLGALFAVYMSNKYFGSKKAPVASVMLFLLAVFCFIYPRIPANMWLVGLLCLAVIGFLTFGPHVLIVTAMPMDFGTRKAAASAAGFIDGWGYIGASFTGIGTGWIIDHFSWTMAFDFWVSGAIIAGLIMAVLWYFKIGAVKGQYH